MRALRWGERTTHLRVRVRWPDSFDRLTASRQQQGAVRGLNAWDGHPLDLVVDAEPQPTEDPESRSSTTGAAPVVPKYRGTPTKSLSGGLIRDHGPGLDFEVQWNVTPRTEERGEAYTSWGPDGVRGGYGLKVVAMSVAQMDRWPGGRELNATEVQAAAAHAMGHALGLPHSPSPDDVMYPGNTATTPSAADLAALAALYTLPNGATIAPPAKE